MLTSSSSSSSSSEALSIFFLFLLFLGPTLARNPHVITLRSQDLLPANLAWDPTAQHFLAGSRLLPAVSSISDAGVIETLVSDPLLPPNSSVAAITIDSSHRRLLVVLSHPAALAAYDLRSPRPHRRIFSSPLPDPSAVPGGVAVDPTTGDAYITSTTSNLIWKVDPTGHPHDFSKSQAYGEDLSGLSGITYFNNGYLLVLQASTGRVFKVDPEDGTARMVLIGRGLMGSDGIAMRSDGSAVVVGGQVARILKSDDGWGEAVVYDEIALEGQAKGVAVREGRRVYVAVEGEGSLGNGGFRVEEVEWERESEGEMVWGLVLLGFGLAYFLYWRFQMGQLVGSINKKRA